jgi:hypothetical protein
MMITENIWRVHAIAVTRSNERLLHKKVGEAVAALTSPETGNNIT